jgi:hypothetical protein
VTGQIAGKPWRTVLDYNEAPVLMRHLGTAAPMTTPTPDERDRIHAAMDRILADAPQRSNGALTVVRSPSRRTSPATRSPSGTPT